MQLSQGGISQSHTAHKEGAVTKIQDVSVFFRTTYTIYVDD